MEATKFLTILYESIRHFIGISGKFAKHDIQVNISNVWEGPSETLNILNIRKQHTIQK